MLKAIRSFLITCNRRKCTTCTPPLLVSFRSHAHNAGWQTRVCKGNEESPSSMEASSSRREGGDHKKCNHHQCTTPAPPPTPIPSIRSQRQQQRRRHSALSVLKAFPFLSLSLSTPSYVSSFSSCWVIKSRRKSVSISLNSTYCCSPSVVSPWRDVGRGGKSDTAAHVVDRKGGISPYPYCELREEGNVFCISL